MKTTKEFCPSDRYHYDNLLLPKGYAQIDTEQDAWYYGHWANPETLTIIGYCEGDVYVTECENLEEFRAELEKMKSWNEEYGYKFGGVDPGLKPEDRQKWINIGLGHLLH